MDVICALLPAVKRVTPAVVVVLYAFVAAACTARTSTAELVGDWIVSDKSGSLEGVRSLSLTVLSLRHEGKLTATNIPFGTGNDMKWLNGSGDWTLAGTDVNLTVISTEGRFGFSLHLCNLIGEPELCFIPDPDSGVSVRYRKR
jgi:hypothetical protein